MILFVVETARPADPAKDAAGSLLKSFGQPANSGKEQPKKSIFGNVIKAAVNRKKEEEAEEKRRKEAEQLLFDRKSANIMLLGVMTFSFLLVDVRSLFYNFSF